MGGMMAGSIALVDFGMDSVIELSAALVVLWRLRLESAGADPESLEQAEASADGAACPESYAVRVPRRFYITADVYAAGGAGEDAHATRRNRLDCPGKHNRPSPGGSHVDS
jgi:hypothetical protein